MGHPRKCSGEKVKSQKSRVKPRNSYMPRDFDPLYDRPGIYFFSQSTCFFKAFIKGPVIKNIKIRPG